MAHVCSLNGIASCSTGSQQKRCPGSRNLAAPLPVILLKPLRMQPSRVACPTETSSTLGMTVTIPASGLQDEAKGSAAMDCHNSSTNSESGIHSEDRQLAWAGYKQCVLLGAAAFCAAPLILVLDISERACLALCQVQQIRQQVVGVADPNSQAQQPQHQLASCSAPMAARTSNSSSSSRPSSTRSGASSRHQPPSALWLLDLWPPFWFMALAVLPPVLLASRHCLVGTPGAIKPLLLCVASLAFQGYVNLYLAVLQRAKPQPLAAEKTVEATGSNNRADNSNDQPHWWRAEAKKEHWAHPQSPARGLHGVEVTGVGTQQKQLSKAHAPYYGICNTVKSAAVVFGLIQVCGDAFRLWCISSAAMTIWQQQAITVLGWASPSSALPTSVEGGMLAVVAAAITSAVSLQQNLAGMVWLAVDCMLSAGSAAVYALAVVARLLPIMDELLQG